MVLNITQLLLLAVIAALSPSDERVDLSTGTFYKRCLWVYIFPPYSKVFLVYLTEVIAVMTDFK